MIVDASPPRCPSDDISGYNRIARNIRRCRHRPRTRRSCATRRAVPRYDDVTYASRPQSAIEGSLSQPRRRAPPADATADNDNLYTTSATQPLDSDSTFTRSKGGRGLA